MISLPCWGFNRDVAGKVKRKMQVVAHIEPLGAERDLVGTLLTFCFHTDKEKRHFAPLHIRLSKFLARALSHLREPKREICLEGEHICSTSEHMHV